MKMRQVLERDTTPVSLRRACDIRRACNPTCESPISPSSSALGTRAATESMTSTRSEEHTSELQSLAYLVCRLLLEKKKKDKLQIKQYSHENTQSQTNE